MALPASVTLIPVVSGYVYRNAAGSVPVGKRVVFIARSKTVVVDAQTVTLPDKLSTKITPAGALQDGFALPTCGDGVYYDVIEDFPGGRARYTIVVKPTDTSIDLATVAPVVTPPVLVSIEQSAVIQAAYTARDAAQASAVAADASKTAAGSSAATAVSAASSAAGDAAAAAASAISASNSAVTASAAKDTATSAAATATTKASEASASATAAAGSTSAAAASASDAATSAGQASTSATAAASSATSASSSATAAANSAASASALGYATLAALNADLVPGDGVIRWVTNDPTTGNNGAYRKSGASGAGSWVAAVDRISQVANETANYRAAGDPTLPLAPTGFAWAIVDQYGRMAVGVTDDGTFKAAAFYVARVSADVVAIGSDEQSAHVPYGFASAVLDANGNMAMGVRNDGKTVVQELLPQKINGLPTELLTKGVVKSGIFHAEINHVPSYGQSLSLGNAAGPIQTPTQPFDSLMFNAGVRAQEGGGSVAANHASLVPLVEVINGSTGNMETPVGFALTQIKRLIAAENLIEYTAQSYQLLGSAPSVSNMSIMGLSKPSTGYQYLLDDINYGYSLSQAAGKSYNVPAVLWSQGEKDYVDGTSLATYQTRFNTLYADINADVKAITGQANDIKLIAYQCVTYSDSPATVALAQLAVSKADPRIVLACPSYCVEHLNPTNVHLTGRGSAHLGAYYALAYKRTVIDGGSFAPLQPVATERQGSIVTVRFATPFEPLAFDTTQLTARTNHGFSLVDNTGAAVAINSVALIGPNIVKIVAASPLPANSKLRYGYSNGGNLRDSQGDSIKIDLPAGRQRLDNWCVAFEELLA